MSKNEKRNATEDQVNNLALAFLSLTDTEECLAFFSDLFTVKEIEEISSRLEVARLLKSGVNYIDIAEKTGASTATISRVSKCLTGARGGYRMVLSRTEEGSDTDKDNCIRTDSLTIEETDALKAIVACFRSKK